jgi:hypothetical protein
MSKKRTYKVGDDVYDIPENEVSDFLKDTPNATEIQSFVVGSDTFDIPINEVSGFLKEIPSAKSLKKKEISESGSKEMGSGQESVSGIGNIEESVSKTSLSLNGFKPNMKGMLVDKPLTIFDKDKYSDIEFAMVKDREQRVKNKVKADEYGMTNTVANDLAHGFANSVGRLPVQVLSGIEYLWKTVNYVNPLTTSKDRSVIDDIQDQDWYKSYIQSLNEHQEAYRDGEKTISEQLKKDENGERDIAGAIRSTALGMSESLPLTIAALFGGAPGLGAVGAVSGGEQYNKLQDLDVSEGNRIWNSTIYAGSEILTEMVTQKYGDILKGVFAREGKKEGTKLVAEGLKGWMGKYLKAAGIYTAPIGEGASEAMNFAAQYMGDVSFGFEEFNSQTLKNGMIDNAAVGLGTGTGFTVIGASGQATKKFSKVQEENATIKSELKIDKPELEKDIYLDKLLKDIPSEYTEGTRKKIAELLVKKDELQFKQDKASEKLKPVFEKQVKAVDNAISDVVNEAEGFVQDTETKGDQLIQKNETPQTEKKQSEQIVEPAKEVKSTISLSEPQQASKAQKGVVKIKGDAESIDINKGNEKVGNIVYVSDETSIQPRWVEVEQEKQGIGTEAYKQLNQKAEQEGKVVRSDKTVLSAGKGLWNSLVKKGEAIKLEDGSYVMQNKNTDNYLKNEKEKTIETATTKEGEQTQEISKTEQTKENKKVEHKKFKVSRVEGLGMGQSQAEGTYFSTEKKNRYGSEFNPAKKMTIEIDNPAEFDQNSNEWHNYRYDILDKNKDTFEPLDFEQVKIPDKITIDELSDKGINKLGKLVTKDLQSKGHDSINFTGKGENEIVVFPSEDIVKSNNPDELYNNFVIEKESTPEKQLTSVESEILKRKINKDSFERFGDRNNITSTVAKSWFTKGEKTNNGNLDIIAQEISDITGQEVSEQDIIDTILKYPSARARKTTDLQNSIRKKYKELTGKSIDLHNFVEEADKIELTKDELSSLDKIPNKRLSEIQETIISGEITSDNIDQLDWLFNNKEDFEIAKKLINDEFEIKEEPNINEEASEVVSPKGETETTGTRKELTTNAKATGKETGKVSLEKVRDDQKRESEKVDLRDDEKAGVEAGTREERLANSNSQDELDKLMKEGLYSINDKEFVEKIDRAYKNGWETREDVPIGVRANDIIKQVDAEIKKTRKEKLSEKENEIRNRIADKVEKLSGSKFAINQTEKNTDVIRNLTGLIKDLADLGIVKFEKGLDHIIQELKKYLPHIDPENIDKYRDDIKLAFDIKEPPTAIIKEKKVSPEELKTVTLEPEKWIDTVLRKVQDKYNRINQLVKAAEKSGYSVTDDMNPALKVELMDQKGIKKIKDKEYEIIHSKDKKAPSLIKRMSKDNVEIDLLGNYLLAKHSGERNLRKMEERNSEIDDKIAKIEAKGESDVNKQRIKELEGEKIKQEELDILQAKADKLIQKVEGLKNADKYKQYAQEVRDRLITARQNELVESGLESQGTIDNLNEVYENYVPYKVLSKQSGKFGKGKTIEGKGKNIYRAKNLIDIEQVDRVNPIYQALFDYNMSVMRGTKNVADQAFLKFAEEIPNDVMTIEQPKYKVSYNADGEVVMQPDILYNKELSDNAIEMRVDGEPVFIRIHDPLLLRAIKETGTLKSIKVLNHVNQWLRLTNTLYNPEFILTNFTRDLQTAGVNINALEQKGLKRKFAKNILPSMRGIWQNEMGNTESKWGKIFEDLKNQGGEIGWLNTGDIEAEISRISKSFNEYNSNKASDKLKRGLNSVVDFIDSANKTVEMASRLAAYKAAIDSGVSKEQAASLAKNLTVNFNKKGELGSLIDSLYLFANAGLQGSTILIKNVGKSGKVQSMVAGITVGSFMLNMLNSFINDDEYEKIDDGIKERNLIVMHPSGNYTKVPLPYGYNIFKVLGDKIYNVSLNDKNIGSESISLFKSIFSTFNPIASSTLSQSISPTISDPFVQISENKSWFGSPIKPEQNQYSAKVPESQLYFGSVRDVSKWASQKINSMTGGTKSISGAIDVSPEYMDHFYDFLSGGIGRFIVNSIETSKELISKEPLEPNKIPFVRSFYGRTDEKQNLGFIYRTKTEAWRTQFSPKEIDKFKKSLSFAYRAKLIDDKEFDNYLNDFYKGQESVMLSRKFPELNRKEIREMLNNKN